MVNQAIATLHSLYTAKKDGFYPDCHNCRWTDNHIFPLDVADGNGDKLLGIMPGHNFLAVPFLEILDGDKSYFFPMTIGKKQMDSKLVGRLGHGISEKQSKRLGSIIAD